MMAPGRANSRKSTSTVSSTTSCELSSCTSESEDASSITTVPNSNNNNMKATITTTSTPVTTNTSPRDDKTRSPVPRKQFPTTINALGPANLNPSNSSLQDFRSLPFLQDRLRHLLDQKVHTDVVFVVGSNKETVEAHRIILCSASPVFNHLFFESKQPPSHLGGESGHVYVQEPEYSAEAFNGFVHAIYTNNFPSDLSLTVALQVFYAAKKYQVVFLEALILAHILQTVSVENVFEALKASTNSIELTEIVPICWKIIEESTNQVLSTHLETLDEHNLTRILTRDHLAIEEVELFQFLVKWGSVQCKRRGMKTTGKNKRLMIEHMLKYIRFPTMNSMDFTDIVIPSRILEPKEIFALQSHFSTLLSGDGNHHSHHHNTNQYSHHSGRASSSTNSPIASSAAATSALLPYDIRPRFHPRVTPRRRESSMIGNNAIVSSNNGIASAGGSHSRRHHQSNHHHHHSNAGAPSEAVILLEDGSELLLSHANNSNANNHYHHPNSNSPSPANSGVVSTPPTTKSKRAKSKFSRKAPTSTGGGSKQIRTVR